jgi:hypothetical protein
MPNGEIVIPGTYEGKLEVERAILDNEESIS